jgi:hypothetical protein
VAAAPIELAPAARPCGESVPHGPAPIELAPAARPGGGSVPHGVDCCIVHLGGTKLAGVRLTMDARQGIEALRTVAPKVAVPVYDDDYKLFTSPLSDFVALAAGAGLVTELHCLQRVDTFRSSLARAA